MSFVGVVATLIWIHFFSIFLSLKFPGLEKPSTYSSLFIQLFFYSLTTTVLIVLLTLWFEPASKGDIFTIVLLPALLVTCCSLWSWEQRVQKGLIQLVSTVTGGFIYCSILYSF